jgi:LAO/AO transport system kinase
VRGAWNSEIERISAGIRSGDVRAVARAISLVENDGSEAYMLLRRLFPYSGQATVIGVTGSPGVGKSTLVDKLALYYRQQGETVGIIAVDPSSPFSGGAILGDRIRMNTLGTDPGVFIRSMATRGNLGGLARATGDAILILDAAGYQKVLVETVGVGQDEVEIVKTVDVTVVVLVPGLGDDVQTIKAGIMEIGDVFAINKADREGVERIEREMLALLSLVERPDGWQPPIVKTVAVENRGIAELAEAIARVLDFHRSTAEADERKRHVAEERLKSLLKERLLALTLSHALSPEELGTLAAAVARRERDPYSIVEQITERLLLRCASEKSSLDAPEDHHSKGAIRP